MRRRGFSLIEMLLALAVLAIGLVTIFALLPGATAYSRDLRDRERMRVFADSVFASAEWALAEHPEDPLSETRPWTLNTVVGDRVLEVGGGTALWPENTSALGEEVPMLQYSLVLNTNPTDAVEVELRVWTLGMPAAEAEIFRSLFPKEGAPW